MLIYAKNLFVENFFREKVLSNLQTEGKQKPTQTLLLVVKKVLASN
jgi:hypothetical protein